MNGQDGVGNRWASLGARLRRRISIGLALLAVGNPPAAEAIELTVGETPGQRRGGHVPELQDCLGKLRIAEPVWFRQLAVYPLLPSATIGLDRDWLTLDTALAQGALAIREKGARGSVPVVLVENRSQYQYVLIMAGEVLGGGKQTRTVRRDVILAPGQRIELEVFCVEAHRWAGEARFSTAAMLVPQSLQKELRRGTDQQRVWAEVARNNRALAAENATGSLARALQAEAGPGSVESSPATYSAGKPPSRRWLHLR